MFVWWKASVVAMYHLILYSEVPPYRYRRTAKLYAPLGKYVATVTGY